MVRMWMNARSVHVVCICIICGLRDTYVLGNFVKSPLLKVLLFFFSLLAVNDPVILLYGRVKKVQGVLKNDLCCFKVLLYLVTVYSLHKCN